MKEIFKHIKTSRIYVPELKLPKTMKSLYFESTFTNYKSKSVKNTVSIVVHIIGKDNMVYNFTPFEFLVANIEGLTTDVFTYNTMKLITTQINKDTDMVKDLGKVMKDDIKEITDIVKRIQTFCKTMN